MILHLSWTHCIDTYTHNSSARVWWVLYLNSSYLINLQLLVKFKFIENILYYATFYNLEAIFYCIISFDLQDKSMRIHFCCGCCFYSQKSKWDAGCHPVWKWDNILLPIMRSHYCPLVVWCLLYLVFSKQHCWPLGPTEGLARYSHFHPQRNST